MKLDHVPSQEELVEFYRLQNENDPTSLYYKRKLLRPKLHIFRVLLRILTTLFLSSGLGVSVFFLFESRQAALWTGIVFLFFVFLIRLKQIAIWIVKVYQRIAPEKVRKRCRYEPSCSQYMIVALEKYGFWKGFRKGFRRWVSCKPPNGGFDEP